MKPRTCAVSAHTRRVPDRPNVDDPLHRQIAGETAFMARHSLTVDDLILNAWLCAELNADLARVFPARSEQQRISETW